MGLDRARDRGRGLEVAEPPISALSAANEIVGRGYYAPTTLSTVDGDLVTGSIKNGITIFGVAGHTDVRNVSDADAVLADVKNGKTFYAVGGARKTGNLATVAIVAANDNYPAGYHAGNVGGLDAIDTDLASANIKSGITIFGKAGSTNVRDSLDANAALADVKNGKTFYAGGGARKTGNLATRTLNPANETVQAGYYAGTTLSAVDAQLANANIKSGIVIFGFTGAATVRDIADANAILSDVKNGRTFYSVTGARKTGNLATVALSAAANAYPAGYHAGAANLTAVDGDLVPANIKDGITIFGVVGTLSATLAEDLKGVYQSGITSTTSGSSWSYRQSSVGAGADYDLVSQTPVFTVGSLAVAAAISHLLDSASSGSMKLRLYMGGVQVAESGVITSQVNTVQKLVATRALNGAQICKISVHNSSGTGQNIRVVAFSTGNPFLTYLVIGSVKTT